MTFPILVFLAVIVAAILGWGLSAFLLPEPLSRRLAVVFAPGAGLGICSLIFFVFRRPMFTVEFALLIVTLLLLFRRRRGGLLPDSWQFGFLGLCLASIVGFALVADMIRLDRMPHGFWDGWAIWNTHARLLFRNGTEWKSLLPYTFHGDYPELVPSLVARLWRYTGEEFPEAGGVIGIVLGLSGLTVLVGTLSELRGTRLGLAMGLVLIGTPFYLYHMTTQYADIPLAFFNLMTVSLLCLHFERAPTNRSMIALAGLAAGCAGWSKNEGLLFIVAMCAALSLPVVLRRSKVMEQLAPFIAGLLIPLAVIVVFKWTVPVHNDLISDQSYQAAVKRITDLSRYAAIVKYFLHLLWTFGLWTVTPFIPLLVFLVSRGINTQVLLNKGWRAASLALALVLAGYFAVYVNTPQDLKYHLDSSFDRLLLHLWPSFLLLLGMCMKRDPVTTPATQGATPPYASSTS